MTVKTLRTILNPGCGRYDERDAIQFLKDPEISQIDKYVAIFGKRWVRMDPVELKRLIEDPELFVKQWFEVNNSPVGC